jgi:hypothetical protein
LSVFDCDEEYVTDGDVIVNLKPTEEVALKHALLADCLKRRLKIG